MKKMETYIPSQINVRIHPELKYLLDMEADSKGMSVNRLMNEIIVERYGVGEMVDLDEKVEEWV